MAVKRVFNDEVLVPAIDAMTDMYEGLLQAHTDTYTISVAKGKSPLDSQPVSDRLFRSRMRPQSSEPPQHSVLHSGLRKAWKDYFDLLCIE